MAKEQSIYPPSILLKMHLFSKVSTTLLRKQHRSRSIHRSRSPPYLQQRRNIALPLPPSRRPRDLQPKPAFLKDIRLYRSSTEKDQHPYPLHGGYQSQRGSHCSLSHQEIRVLPRKGDKASAEKAS
jgi:hypothetical protein